MAWEVQVDNMQPEESKKYLENIVGDGSMEFVFQPINTEVLVNAIEAIDKQVPKIPDGRKCPYCYNTAVYRYRKFKYCPECGQKMMWEEKI